jgi:ABC-2 type transport system ATP-binding protein
VLFLDEPTVGLDPQTRAHIWSYINELRRRESITMFLTSHYMDEAENCDRVAIMDEGRIVALDTLVALKASVGQDRIEIRTDDDEAAIAALQERFSLTATKAEGAVRVYVPGGEEFVPRLFAELGVPIRAVNVARPTLDDVFMSYTGRTIRDAEASTSDKAAGNPWRRRAMARGRR